MAQQKYSPIPELTPEEIIRFWSHVQRGEPTECWPWITPPKPGRYGNFGVKRDGEWMRYISTRVMWRVTKGEDPGQVGIAHTCDNPPCMNPDHHFKATQQENIDDCRNKGRWVKASFEASSESHKRFFAANPERAARGEKNPNAVLTESDVREIRTLQGLSLTQAGKRFGVGPYAIWRIRSGRGWKHVV